MPKRLPIDRDKVAKLWQQGLSSRQIAERMRFSPSYIQNIIWVLKLATPGTTRQRYDSFGGAGKAGQKQRIASRT